MKITRQNIMRCFSTCVLVGAMLTLGFNCSQFNSSGGGGGGDSSSFANPENVPPVAFLSSEQILKTMLSVTGTEGLGELNEASDVLIDDTYNARSGSLPSTQEMGQATGPTLIAATNLASSVCAKAVDRDIAVSDGNRGDRMFFQEFNFAVGLTASDSSSMITEPFSRLARNAWRREATQAELDMIVGFAQEFVAGKAANADPKAQARLLAISICTAAIASTDALTY